MTKKYKILKDDNIKNMYIFFFPLIQSIERKKTWQRSYLIEKKNPLKRAEIIQL